MSEPVATLPPAAPSAEVPLASRVFDTGIEHQPVAPAERGVYTVAGLSVVLLRADERPRRRLR